MKYFLHEMDWRIMTKRINMKLNWRLLLNFYRSNNKVFANYMYVPEPTIQQVGWVNTDIDAVKVME